MSQMCDNLFARENGRCYGGKCASGTTASAESQRMQTGVPDSAKSTGRDFSGRIRRLFHFPARSQYSSRGGTEDPAG